MADSGAQMPATIRTTTRSIFLYSAAAIAVIMFAGFARNYYLRVWLGTRPMSIMVHLHGLIMTALVSLFVTQTLLVSTQRVALHRKLGVVGAVLAVIVLALGVYTIAVAIARQVPAADPLIFALYFVAFDGVSLCLFAGFVAAALSLRQRPDIHKRLMLLAMIAMLPPAYGRFVAYFTHRHIEIIVVGLMVLSVLACLIADTMRQRRLHPVFLYGGLLILATNLLTYFAQAAL